MNRPSYGYSAEDSPQPDQQPTCPRHPDRVSYVRCKRCERPACPDCQRGAAVGMLCVDCERQLNRQQASTRPRNSMGAAMTRGAPVVTYTLIALCVLAYLGQMLAPHIVNQLGMFAPFRALVMPWTFLSAGFLHAGILHLVLNMYALYICGQYLEQVMGRWRFAAVYLISVLGGHTAVFLLTSAASLDWFGGTLGASGGVFGLFAALFIVNRNRGAQTTQILVLIGLNLVITFTVSNISWQGHLGGLAMGAAVTAAMFALRPRATATSDRQALGRRAALLHGGVIAAAVVLCLLLVAGKAVMVGML